MSPALMSSSGAVISSACWVPQNLIYLPSDEVRSPPGCIFNKQKELERLFWPIVGTFPHGHYKPLKFISADSLLLGTKADANEESEQYSWSLFYWIILVSCSSSLGNRLLIFSDIWLLSWDFYIKSLNLSSLTSLLLTAVSQPLQASVTH